MKNITHEREAEELRNGIEKLIENAPDCREHIAMSASLEDRFVSIEDLRDLLDRVDARDSLAFLEKKASRKKKRVVSKKEIR